MATWYYKNGDQKFGPCNDQQLKGEVVNGRITSETLIRQGENGNWFRADQIPGLLNAPPTMNQPPTMEGSPPWYQNPTIVGIITVFFFPLGLVLLWIHPTWKKQTKIIVSCVVGFVVVLAAIFGESETDAPNHENYSQEKESTSRESDIPSVSAMVLLNEYSIDPDETDKKYKNKVIEVHGTIPVGLDGGVETQHGSTVLIAANTKKGEYGQIETRAILWLNFKGIDLDAAGIKQGSYIKVRGRVDRSSYNSPLLEIHMKDCVIIE